MGAFVKISTCNLCKEMRLQGRLRFTDENTWGRALPPVVLFVCVVNHDQQLRRLGTYRA